MKTLVLIILGPWFFIIASVLYLDVSGMHKEIQTSRAREEFLARYCKALDYEIDVIAKSMNKPNN